MSSYHAKRPIYCIVIVAVASIEFLGLAVWAPGDAPWWVRLWFVIVGGFCAFGSGALIVIEEGNK